MSTSPQSVAEVVGRAMQRLREESGRRQEDVAAAARALGLKWNQATVAAFEGGRRTVTADLLLALPAIYSRVLGREFRLRELFSEPVVVAPELHLLPQQVEQALSDSWPRVFITFRQDVPGEAERKAARKFGVSVNEVMAAARRVWGHGLTYERDELLGLQDSEWLEEGVTVSKRTAQAVRGHITRTLLAELEQELQRQQPEEGQ
jgi:transcriptional regulator with XRE-family HTH domain